MSPSDPHTTLLLNRLARGDAAAADEVLPRVYDELRDIAGAYMRRQGPASTLQATALVNEAWLRVAGAGELDFGCRSQFLALAARAMRSVLVDAARARAAEKRGGGAQRVTLFESIGADGPTDVDLLALDEALEALSERDPEAVRVVELRFFGGLSHPEIADATGSSLRTVERRWWLARAWLRGELQR